MDGPFGLALVRAPAHCFATQNLHSEAAGSGYPRCSTLVPRCGVSLTRNRCAVNRVRWTDQKRSLRMEEGTNVIALSYEKIHIQDSTGMRRVHVHHRNAWPIVRMVAGKQLTGYSARIHVLLCDRRYGLCLRGRQCAHLRVHQPNVCLRCELRSVNNESVASTGGGQ